MIYSNCRDRGFSLIELMVVTVFIGVIASFAIPQYMIYIETAHATACLVERGQTNRLIISYNNDHLESPLTSFSQLVSSGMLEEEPNCPYGGEWVLVPAEKNQGFPAVGCSLHFWPEDDAGSAGSEPLTSLGSGFDEIISAMIALISNYYDENGKYPRSWGDYAFSDIGLDPEEWQDGVEGIVYSPVGKRIGVTPEDGYTFYVQGANGQEMELPSSRNWSLWYSMDDGNWYFRNTNSKNIIDISTLSVVAD